MPPTFFQRLAIIVLGSTALMADTLWMLNTEAHSAARQRAEVSNSVIEKRFVDFGEGPLVGAEGDLAPGGI